VSRLDEERRKKSFSDLVIEKSVELFGYTPDEKSDRNMKWMRENGYMKKHKRARQRSGDDIQSQFSKPS
jgi:hypothetical protein